MLFVLNEQKKYQSRKEKKNKELDNKKIALEKDTAMLK